MLSPIENHPCPAIPEGEGENLYNLPKGVKDKNTLLTVEGV